MLKSVLWHLWGLIITTNANNDLITCALVVYPDLCSKTNLFQRQLMPGHDNAVKRENENLSVLQDRAVITKA